MEKNKKIIIYSICAIILIAIITVGIIWLVNKNNNEESTENIKLDKVYAQLQETDNYTFTLKVDDKNQMITKIKGNNARIENYDSGNETITIIEDGNTYILMPKSKKGYLYKNNTTGLIQLKENMETLKNMMPSKGEEEINNKKYRYEEFKGVSIFLVNYNKTLDENTLKTTIYYDKDKMAYIKTSDKDFEQLVEVNLQYSSDLKEADFVIPSDYEIIE